MMSRLAIIGSALGGGAAQIIEALDGSDSVRAVFILDRDVNAIGQIVQGISVAGSTEDLVQKWNAKEFDVAVIAIGGDLEERRRQFELLDLNSIPLANVIDRSVKVGLNVVMGTGNVILNSCYFGNNVKVGSNNYILNQCSVQHDTVIGNHNYFATNVTIGAKVRIGSMNRFGIKSIVETRATIEDGQTFKSAAIYP